MKVLLLDADGVVLKKHRYFSDTYAEDYGIPPEKVIPFFKNEFRKCQEGEADLKEELVPYLKQWNWSGSVEEFMRYWFDTDTEVDNEVLDMVQKFREQGVQCYLATDQEKYRAEYIREMLHGELDGFFFSCEVGASKDTPEFFTAVLKSVNVEPGEVTYFDDDQVNVKVAEKMGIDSHFYTDIAALRNLQ